MYTVCIPTFINSLHQDRTDETGLPVSSNRNYMYVVFTSCMNIKKNRVLRRKNGFNRVSCTNAIVILYIFDL